MQQQKTQFMLLLMQTFRRLGRSWLIASAVLYSIGASVLWIFDRRELVVTRLLLQENLRVQELDFYDKCIDLLDCYVNEGKLDAGRALSILGYGEALHARGGLRHSNGNTSLALIYLLLYRNSEESGRPRIMSDYKLLKAADYLEESSMKFPSESGKDMALRILAAIDNKDIDYLDGLFERVLE